MACVFAERLTTALAPHEVREVKGERFSVPWQHVLPLVTGVLYRAGIWIPSLGVHMWTPTQRCRNVSLALEREWKSMLLFLR